MTDSWKTLRVPPEAYKYAKVQKDENDRTWGEQIVREENETPDTGEQIVMLKTDVMKLSDELAEVRGKIDDLQAQLPKDVATELER